MVCPTCGLDNDPAAPVCARCNTALAGAAPPPPPGPAPWSGRPAAGFDRPSRNGNRLPLIAALAVVALIAVVAAGVVLYRDDSGDGTSPAAAPGVPAGPTGAQPTDAPPTDTQPTADTDTAAARQQQAQVIDALLDRSIGSRNKLNQAIDRINRCTDLNGALADMRAVGDERRDQIAALGDADLSALPTGETLRSTLTAALQHSLDADQAYVSWAEPTVSRGCASTGSRNAAYARGRSASTEAGAAKTTFLAQWNPVATSMGLSARSRDKI